MKLHQLVEQCNTSGTPEPGSSMLLPGDTIDLKELLNVFKTINRSLILDDVIVLVLDNAIRIARAERGFLLLGNEKNELRTVMARDSKNATLDSDRYTISESIARDVYRAGESVCVEHAQHDKLYDTRSSILSLSLETILCSPLIVRGEVIGIIYVDSKHIQPVNRNEIINLFEILAGQAAVAIKNAQLYESVTKAFNDLQNANDVLLKMDRLAIKGEIAAEVSHELKNLFQVTLLQFDSLERHFMRIEKEAALERVRDAHQSVKRIELFARGLLENSSMKVNKTLGSLNRTIGDTVALLQPLRKFKFAYIETAFGANIPYFCFDTQQIQQLLLNLMNNAVEACSAGVTITITTELLEDAHEVMIRISDDGPGIPDDVIRKLFNVKITTKADGHGYGLSICRKIAENHYGSIKVTSTPGKGATFAVCMPIVVE